MLVFSSKRFKLLLSVSILALGLTACNTAPRSQQEIAAQQEENASFERIGDRALETGDHQNAITMYRRILATDPNNSSILIKLGDALIAAGIPGDALVNYQAALKLDPSNADALAGVGYSYVLLEQTDKALEFYKQAAAHDPNPKSYSALGVAYDLNGEHQAAQATYRDALANDPKNLNIRNNMGLSLLLTNDYDAAANVLQSVVNTPQATEYHRSNLALAYGLMGKSNAARRVLQKDLSEKDIARNIEVYQSMRKLSGRSLREAILMGQARHKVVQH